MASFARKFWDFAVSIWPIVLFYVLAALIVACGVLNHPEQLAPATKAQPFMPNGSDTVPNKISCQFRGSSFCHKKEYHV